MARWNKTTPRGIDFDRFFPPSIPLPARGGIRAHSRQGAFATSWWGRRWIETLESFRLHSRLARGRSYARRGQVLHLEIAKRRVSATVQGSRPRPYTVTIELGRIPVAQWRKVSKAMAAKVAVAARLMAGELPSEAEQCFAETGVALFPATAGDLITSCSCPDFSNPCKHIAAVYYLLAEEFDRDPFLLFRLRGMERSEFVAMLGKGGSSAPRRAGGPLGESYALPETRNLATSLEVFWRGRQFAKDGCGEVAISGEAAPLARRLGSLPFWRSQGDFLEALCNRSRSAAERGLAVFLQLPQSLDR